MANKQSPERGVHRAVAKEFAESTLGPRPAERERTKETQETEPRFEDRSEAEQIELMYNIHSLVDERKLLKQSLTLKESERHVEGAFDLRKVAGRYVTMPIPGESSEHELYDNVAEAQTKDRLTQVEAELKEMGATPGLHEAYEKKLVMSYYFTKVARTVDTYRARNAAIDRSIEQLSQSAKEGVTGSLTGKKARQVELLEKERDQLTELIGDFESTVLTHEGADRQLAETQQLARIENYADGYQRGYMVEFPSAHRTVEDALDSMRRRQPLMLVGHLGTGKTELAMHATKLFMIENGIGYDPAEATDVDKLYQKLQPEIFSGSEEASVYDLIGKLKLKTTGNKPSAVKKQLTELKRGLKDTSYSIPDKELTKVLLGKSDVVETVFTYGPLGRALKEGKPMIIDEINRIPPEVNARLNFYLTQPVGREVRIQENSEDMYPIKPGFVFLSTGNLGREYNVKQLELSFKSRWTMRQLDYPEPAETYDLVTAALVRKDRPRLPENFPIDQYEKLADLTIATREIQEVFSGQAVGNRFMSMVDRTAPEQSQLERSVISTRDLMRKVIGAWKDRNFKDSLDDVVAKEILGAEVENKDEQKFMTEIFIRRGFFEGWDSKYFKKYGIDVTDREIKVLQVQMDTQEYKESDKRFGELHKAARERASLTRANLLIGARREEQ